MTKQPTSSNPAAEPVRISLTRFADFCVSDPSAQYSKVLEIFRQYQKPYRPAEAFWSRWIEGVTQIHGARGDRANLQAISASALHNRGGQYESACNGYARFWAGHDIEVIDDPKPCVWESGRLQWTTCCRCRRAPSSPAGMRAIAVRRD